MTQYREVMRTKSISVLVLFVAKYCSNSKDNRIALDNFVLGTYAFFIYSLPILAKISMGYFVKKIN